MKFYLFKYVTPKNKRYTKIIQANDFAEAYYQLKLHLLSVRHKNIKITHSEEDVIKGEVAV